MTDGPKYPSSFFADAFREDPTATTIRGVQHQGPDANQRAVISRGTYAHAEVAQWQAMPRGAKVRLRADLIDDALSGIDLAPIDRLRVGALAAERADGAFLDPRRVLPKLLEQYRPGRHRDALDDLDPERLPHSMVENVRRLNGEEFGIGSRILTEPALAATALFTDLATRFAPDAVAIGTIGGIDPPQLSRTPISPATLMTRWRPTPPGRGIG